MDDKKTSLVVATNEQELEQQNWNTKVIDVLGWLLLHCKDGRPKPKTLTGDVAYNSKFKQTIYYPWL